MSTKFTDGPAAGKVLALRRIPMPLFLRVVKAPDGTIDALDQAGDAPGQDETIFVYRKASSGGNALVDGRDPKTGKRFGYACEICTYALNETQPDDTTARDKAAWPAWCKAEYERMNGVTARQ
jgi:hypothetical protein